MWFRCTLMLCTLLLVAFPPNAAGQLQFQIETVDADGNTGIGASLALDSRGRPHVAYVDVTNHTIHYTIKTGAIWTAQPGPLYGDEGTDVTLVLDAADNADNPGITRTGTFYRREGDSWVGEAMGGFGPWFSTVAQDAAGGLQGVTIWSYGSGLYRGYVSYTVRIGETWSDMVLSDDGAFIPTDPHASIVIDQNGDPHISVTQTFGDSVRYWHRADGVWSKLVLTPGAWSSIALDAQDVARISYYDTVRGDLVLAFQHNGAWATVPLDQLGDVGQYTSQVIRGGVSYITYYAKSPGDLRYAAFDPSVGAQDALIETVDSEGDVGAWTSLALDGQDLPHIAYYDVGNGDLKYASASKLVPTEGKTIGGVKWLYQR